MYTAFVAHLEMHFHAVFSLFTKIALQSAATRRSHLRNRRIRTKEINIDLRQSPGAMHEFAPVVSELCFLSK